MYNMRNGKLRHDLHLILFAGNITIMVLYQNRQSFPVESTFLLHTCIARSQAYGRSFFVV